MSTMYTLVNENNNGVHGKHKNSILRQVKNISDAFQDRKILREGIIWTLLSSLSILPYRTLCYRTLDTYTCCDLS